MIRDCTWQQLRQDATRPAEVVAMRRIGLHHRRAQVGPALHASGFERGTAKAIGRLFIQEQRQALLTKGEW